MMVVSVVKNSARHEKKFRKDRPEMPQPTMPEAPQPETSVTE